MEKYSTDFLLQLYTTMLRIRVCEESLVEPILKGEIICPCHLCTGQEAVSAGICAALGKDDYIFGTHRSHGHYLAKGGSMARMIAEIFGRETGCSRGRGGSMHIIDTSVGMMGAAPIVAGTISLALGAALSSKIRKNGRLAVCFFGDGATGEGVLYESLNFAALKSLPIVFVCENNLYSTHLSIDECRPNRDIYLLGTPLSITSAQVDGNDVLQVYETMCKAVDMCRAGQGPYFIECMTYRLRGHVGPDDNIQGCHTDIRPKSELDEWLKRDPVKCFENILLDQGIINAGESQDISKQVEQEVLEAYSFARNSPCPSTEELSNYVFKQ